MSAPRLTIDLQKIRHNARILVARLAPLGISVTGVTKATLGNADIANTLLQAGVSGIGDSRIENIETMRRAGVLALITLIRAPMISQVERVVRAADVSLNTELGVIRKLSEAAAGAGCIHGVVLMVELGDLREGFMPCDVESAALEMLRLPNITFTGIGTNLACRSGVAPDDSNMRVLSNLAGELETRFDLRLRTISGGNSANLSWAMSGTSTSRINDLRLGESILLGREPLHRVSIPGLWSDAMTLHAEVIESKWKPSAPTGALGQTAFGSRARQTDHGIVAQSLLAIGRQDVDPDGLQAPEGIQVLGSSSDHLVIRSQRPLQIGSEVVFGLNYSALLRAMTSPFVEKSAQSTTTSQRCIGL